MKRALLPIGLSIAAAAIFMLWPETATPPPALDTPPATIATPVLTPSTTAPPVTTNTEPTFRIGKQTLMLEGDTLLPTPALVELFNTWLADTQSKRYEEWKPNALQQAEALPVRAREQLSRWLDQYVELNLALQLMSVQGEPTWDNILANVRNARDAYFNESELALFADQIALENFTESAVNAFADGNNPLATLVDLQQDASKLPESVRGKVDTMLNQLSQSLQQDPNLSNNTQSWHMLVQANAAATLETPSVDLTEANADFLKRYNAYSEARETMLQQGASEDQLRVLRESNFTGTELLRAGTFDKALAE